MKLYSIYLTESKRWRRADCPGGITVFESRADAQAEAEVMRAENIACEVKEIGEMKKGAACE